MCARERERMCVHERETVFVREIERDLIREYFCEKKERGATITFMVEEWSDKHRQKTSSHLQTRIQGKSPLRLRPMNEELFIGRGHILLVFTF